MPKTKRAFCKGKECKKHQVHKVTQYKTGKASLYAQGARHRPSPSARLRVPHVLWGHLQICCLSSAHTPAEHDTFDEIQRDCGRHRPGFGRAAGRSLFRMRLTTDVIAEALTRHAVALQERGGTTGSSPGMVVRQSLSSTRR